MGPDYSTVWGKDNGTAFEEVGSGGNAYKHLDSNDPGGDM